MEKDTILVGYSGCWMYRQSMWLCTEPFLSVAANINIGFYCEITNRGKFSSLLLLPSSEAQFPPFAFSCVCSDYLHQTPICESEWSIKEIGTIRDLTVKCVLISW